jgi:hypothetical protein
MLSAEKFGSHRGKDHFERRQIAAQVIETKYSVTDFPRLLKLKAGEVLAKDKL